MITNGDENLSVTNSRTNLPDNTVRAAYIDMDVDTFVKLTDDQHILICRSHTETKNIIQMIRK